MKKIALAGLVAFALIAIAQQQASAWTNTKFGIGLNFERQAGGNSAIWGLWRNGQPPGPDSFTPSGPGFPFHGPRMIVPNGAYVAPQAGTVAPQSFAPAPAGFPIQGAYAPGGPTYATPTAYGTPYQFANYPRQAYYYTMPYGR